MEAEQALLKLDEFISLAKSTEESKINMENDAIIVNLADGSITETKSENIFCKRCGIIKESCTCQMKTEHIQGCKYLRAANLSFELPCDHGFQACPICDPCTCGIEGLKGIR